MLVYSDCMSYSEDVLLWAGRHKLIGYILLVILVIGLGKMSRLNYPNLSGCSKLYCGIMYYGDRFYRGI
jgi:hypothetical protein